MQATNKPLKGQSRCMYCGSTNRGKGCRYGPHETHFHPDDSTKCAYCGSSNYGRGCRINPIGDLHVHGINYNSMFKEKLNMFLTNKLLINELKTPFNKFKAYELGLINDKGEKIKQPTTVYEKESLSPLVLSIIRLKKFLGSKIDLLTAQEELKESTSLLKYDSKKHSLILTYKDQIKSEIEKICCVLEEAKKEGLTTEEVFSLIET